MSTDNKLDDDDLDDLLDEFDEQVLSKPPGAKAEPAEEPFKHNINNLVKDLEIEDPQAKAQFEELVKQFEQTHMADAEQTQTPQNFDAVMKETVARLKKSGATVDEQLKADPAGAAPEDMLSQLLSGLGNDDDFDMSKLLTDMLEQLLSKEVIYEPMKDLNSKFPQYLTDNKDTLLAEDHARFTKQYEVSGEILAVFDAPGYDNDNQAHRENVNSLLETLQELGNPPTELVGDEKDFPGFGGLGNLGGLGGLDFDSKDLPKDFEKDLEEGCKQS